MVDYKTIVSTTDSKVTLMQWLQSLAKEFDNAKITDMTFSNDGNSALTFTFKLTDGTTKTATCKAVTLTDDEKSIISGLVGQVATSTDGLTFSKAVTFAGNIVVKGNEIHNGYASFLGDESHAGAELHKGECTYTDLKTDSITATDGQDLLSYDGTNVVLGSSAKKAVIMGSGDRPTYSKNGSDFTGSELALKSDVSAVSDIHFFNPNATDMTGVFTNCDLSGKNIYCHNMGSVTKFSSIFRDLKCKSVTIDKVAVAPYNWMQGATFTKFTITDGTSTKGITAFTHFFHSAEFLTEISLFDTSSGTNFDTMFYACKRLKEIPAFDFSNGTSFQFAFSSCYALTAIHATGWKASFNIHYSNGLDAEALREIIGNLTTVTSTKTLGMSAAQLAKLNASDITTANEKGWSLVQAS